MSWIVQHHKAKQKSSYYLGRVAHSCNPRPLKAEAGGTQFDGQPELYNETLCCVATSLELKCPLQWETHGAISLILETIGTVLGGFSSIAELME